MLADFANIICGVPQGSVLGPLKLCLYLLPMRAILKYHKICYQPLEAISKVVFPNLFKCLSTCLC